MSQVTQGLIDEFKRYLEKGVAPPFTLNEFTQLCFAWEELERVRRVVDEIAEAQRREAA